MRLAMLMAAGALAVHAADSSQTTSFRTRAGSGGWTDVTLAPRVAIYVPMKINGHDTMGLLNPGEPSSIDKEFSTSLGLPTATDADGLLDGLVIEVGDVTVRNTSAKPDELFTMPASMLSQPVSFLKADDNFRPFLLGDQFFKQVAVDLDFSGRRIAFRNPNVVKRPSGAVELPLIESDGVRTVPVSIDGAPPAQFALHISNVLGPMMATPSYAAKHQLLDGHPTSARLSVPFTETVVTMDQVFGVAFVSPNSPAEAAGFKKGELIKLIDGRPIEAWSPQEIARFPIAEPGTSHRLVMEDGTERQVVAQDFF
jgi:hypothetical protein